MRIAIIGIGGVGGYYGGKLARHYANQDGIDVIFIAKGGHLKEIQKNGLRQITEEGTFTAIPTKATDKPAELGVFDLVLFCVKGYDLESVAEILKNNVNDRSIVISLLNGVDNAERLKRVLADAIVLNGCVYIGAHIVKPGVVRQAGGSCRLFFGPENRELADYRGIENLLRSANIKAEYREDIKNVVWEKYLFVSPLASATTFLGKTFGELMDDLESKELLEGLIKEVEIISRAQGVELPGDIIQKSLDKISLFPYGTKSSMQMDFEKGKNTEIDTFTGYVVSNGKECGIKAPLHEMVYDALLKKLAA